jgi:hypothetical protein
MSAHIYWDQFTWEAFATLAAGASAVAGAVTVGLRQVGIAERQIAILERQVALDELKVRGELFDRRWLVYCATRDFVLEVTRLAARPSSDVQNQFAAALQDAPFLFGEEAISKLQEIWKRSLLFFAIQKGSAHMLATTGAYTSKHIDKENEYLLWLAEIAQDLGAVFGDELKLFDTTAAKAARS